MDPLQVALIGLLLMLLLMAIGMPVAFAMLLAGVLGNAYVLSTDAATFMMATTVWEQFSSYGLSVVPLFVLMGVFAHRSGVTERLYDAAYKWFGRLPGGLACTTVAASTGFSAICGSNSATTAAMGTIALPSMRRYKYSPTLSAGAVAVGGTLGVLIPPSVVLIVMAVLTEQSLLRLFLASLVPGLVLAALFLVTIVWLCAHRPELGPAGPQTGWADKFKALGGVFETLLLFGIVIGGLYGGFFTPTEAGAVGAFGALMIGLVRRQISLKVFAQCLTEALRISAMVILLIACAVLFGRFLTASGLPAELAQWATALPVSPDVILLVVVIIFLVGGAVMDALGFLIVMLPIFYPLAVALGFDAVWFVVLMTLVTTMGAVTPPVGVNVFIVRGLMPEIPVHKVYAGVGYFAVAYVLCLTTVWLFPAVVLFLPSAMLGSG